MCGWRNISTASQKRLSSVTCEELFHICLPPACHVSMTMRDSLPKHPPPHLSIQSQPQTPAQGQSRGKNEWVWGFPKNIALDVCKGILRTCCITSSWQEMETLNTRIGSTCGMCMWSTKSFGKILFHSNQET